MALVLANRVQETATPNTTVSFTLTGAVSGFQTFAVIGNTNTTYYSATDSSGNWEVGLGTYATSGPTLTRTTIYASSNSGSAVTFPGSVNVFVTYPSGRSVNLDGSGNVSALGVVTSGTWQGGTIQSGYGGTGLTTFTGANNALYSTSSSALTAGTLPVAAGGSGATTLTGYVKGNGTSAFTASASVPNSDTTATSANTANAIVARDASGNFSAGTITATLSGNASTATSATNVAGGAANRIVFNTAASTTSFVTAPTTSSTFLQWNGSAFTWAAASVPCATPTVAGKVFGRTDSSTTSNTALGYQANANSSNGVVVVGYNSNASSTNTVVVGKSATAYGPGCISAYSTVIGDSASTNASYVVAVGAGAGAYSCSFCASGSTVLGAYASSNHSNAVVVGAGVSSTGPCQTHIAPIRSVGSITGLQGLFYNNCTKEVIRGTAGGGVCFAMPTVAGKVYGKTTTTATAPFFDSQTYLGYSAGNTPALCFMCGCVGQVGIGYQAGGSSQRNYAIAVGYNAGQNCQSRCAVAVGAYAGGNVQGISAIAIGALAASSGQGTAAVAIGYGAGNCFQPPNSIVIAACGLGFNASGACQFHVKPIRSASTCYQLYYNPCTGEITYS